MQRGGVACGAKQVGAHALLIEGFAVLEHLLERRDEFVVVAGEDGRVDLNPCAVTAASVSVPSRNSCGASTARISPTASATCGSTSCGSSRSAMAGRSARS